MTVKLKSCRWKCGRQTVRRCRICLECCNERDERNKQIDAGLEAYIAPQDRPGHRFYERKQRSEAQKAGAAKRMATIQGNKRAEMGSGGVLGQLDEETWLL